MAGHEWLNPEERKIILNSLMKGDNWATASHKVIGTTANKVDDTFCDTMQTILETEAAVAKRDQGMSYLDEFNNLRDWVTPTFTSITPATGDAGGGETKIIVGTGFNPAVDEHGAHTLTVSIGGHDQTIVHVTPTTIELKTVAHAAEAAQHVIITNPSTKNVETADAYATIAAATPTFTSMVPTSGSSLDATAVVVTGTNFKEGVTVMFDNVDAPVHSWSATKIYCVAQPHAAGAVHIDITNLSTNTVNSAAAFTYT